MTVGTTVSNVKRRRGAQNVLSKRTLDIMKLCTNIYIHIKCVIPKWCTIISYSDNQSKMTFETEFKTLADNTFIWAKLLV